MMKKRKKRYADGGEVTDEMTVTGQRPQSIGFDMNRMVGTRGGQMGPPSPTSGGMGPSARMAPAPAPVQSRRQMPIARTAGYVGPTLRGDNFQISAGAGQRGAIGAGGRFTFKKGGAVKKMAKGGKLTDLTGDGKVTRADVLKGRGVPGFSKGGSTASKRADGCAIKGKTKGRFV
jgi:hypothetical protein